MFELTGRTALVTGASGGIGSAIARAMATSGAEVGLSGTRVEALETLARSIGDRAHVVPVNLAEADGPEALADAAEKMLGRIDIVVSNAGITRDSLALRMSADDWDAVLALNLTASFRLVKACLRGMLKRRWGRIIGISSIVAATGNPGQANYAAAKAGMIGMMKSLGQEVASRGITVNCVAPGFIDTPMTEALPEDRRNGIIAAIPVARLGTPDDVAGCTVFLASEEAGYVTGQTIHVNGGMAMI